MIFPRPTHRRGFSLVELLATITVLTILLGLCAGLIRVLLKLDQSSRDALAVAADSNRLARDFRDDAHSATSSPPPKPSSDRLTWTTADDSEVVYTVRPRDLLREVSRAGKVQHRELYRRPARSSVQFEANLEGTVSLISIVIHREANPNGTSAAGDDRIDAEFGRIHRLTARQP